MAELFLMPQATPTMTVAVIAKWIAAEGAELAPQGILAQVETDKATMEIEVFDRCVLLKHLVAEGEEVAVGAPVAILGKKQGEDVSALIAEADRLRAAAKAAPAAPAAPAPVVEAAPVAEAPKPVVEAPKPAPKAETPRVTQPGVVPTLTWMGGAIDASIMEPLGTYTPPQPRIVASPLARAMAEDKGVKLSSLRGSGPDGRIVAADVEAAANRPAGPVVPADTTVRATQMRKTIARRLTEVHQQVPVFFLTATLDAQAFVQVRQRAEKRGIKVSYNDLLLKAVASALRDVPECNAAWQGDTILRRGAIDIGVAVALPEGLITPVIRNADTKSVREIAAEVRALAGRAKEGKLAPEEYTGGSFSVSNLGMFEIDQFTAILNPPEAAILAVGSVQQVPVVVGGALAVGWRMKVTMTCDHRVIDGALGARFLQALRDHVEAFGLGVL